MQKLRIYHFDVKEKRMTDVRLYMANESTLDDTLKDAYQRLNLESIVPIERCRLVAYDSKTDYCEYSFEGHEYDEVGTVLETQELLLETRDENSRFPVYLKCEIMIRV